LFKNIRKNGGTIKEAKTVQFLASTTLFRYFLCKYINYLLLDNKDVFVLEDFAEDPLCLAVE
jgi:hypothetical protein